MNIYRTALVRAAAVEAEIPAEFAELLAAEYPWLDGVEEVSESLGAELLAELAAQAKLQPEHVHRFVCAYNARLRALANPFAQIQSEAYSAMSSVLLGHGREDAFGDGDYWLNAASFATREPTIVVFGDYRFSKEAVLALQRILSSSASVFSELCICSEEGSDVLRLRPL